MSHAEQDMIGATLGNYRLVSEIGRGGMGVVYLATHVLMERKAAVKILAHEHARSRDGVTRLFNEARTTARLEHAAFVEVFDCGTTPDGRPFIVMEYIDGESLTAVIGRDGPLPVARAVTIARAVAEAIAVAHASGIIHRDLKPDNILTVTTKPGTGPASPIKILDFGIAKLTVPQPERAGTRAGTLLGTPLYMSPEQCRGDRALDGRADIYSLGCIVFALVTGSPPFPSSTEAEALSAHLTAPVPRLAALRPDVPPSLDALVTQALAKDPQNRPQSMAALAGALAEVERELGQQAESERRPPTRLLPLAGAESTTLSQAAIAPPARGSTRAAPDRRRALIAGGAGLLLAGGGAWLIRRQLALRAARPVGDAPAPVRATPAAAGAVPPTALAPPGPPAPRAAVAPLAGVAPPPPHPATGSAPAPVAPRSARPRAPAPAWRPRKL